MAQPPRGHRARRILSALVALGALIPAAASAQDQPAATRPEAARRTVRVFDFEEPDNFERLPLDWQPIVHHPPESSNPGFPEFNKSSFDFEIAGAGAASVRLPTRGGSTRLRSLPGVLPCFPTTDYQVSALIRTSGLEHARAFLTVRFLDQSQRPIPGAEVRSAPVLSEEVWTRTTVSLQGISPAAGFMQIDLELLQPRLFEKPGDPGSPSFSHQVVHEDLDGAANFDDVTVLLVPRLTISTGVPANIVSSPSRPELTLSLRDITQEPIEARLLITDLDGAAVTDLAVSLPPDGRPTVIQPSLPLFGAYTAVLSIRNGDQVLGDATTHLLWLAPDAGPDQEAPGAPVDRTRLGFVGDDLGRAALADVPVFSRASRVGFVVLPAWSEGVTTAESARDLAARAPIIDRLLDRGTDVTLALTTVPPELARKSRIGPADVVGMLAGDSADLTPFLRPVLDRYGQQVVRWQIGTVASPAPPIPPGRLDGLTAELRRYVPVPILSVCVPSQDSPASASPAISPTIVVNVADCPAALDKLAAALGSATTNPPTIVLRSNNATESPERIGAILRAAAESWKLFGAADAGMPLRLAIPAPILRSSGDQPCEPSADLAAWRTFIEHVAGRRFVGELPAGLPGAEGRCLIFAPHSGAGPSNGVLVAWTENQTDPPVHLEAYLGAGPIRLCDAFGNRSPAEPLPGVAHAVSIPLSPVPVFIEGVDPALCAMLASFRVEPSFLAASPDEHEVELVLTNTLRTSVAGQVQLISPGAGLRTGSPMADLADAAWTVRPMAPVAVAAPPGAQIRVPVSLSFTRAADTGARRFVAVLRLTSEGDLPPLILTAPVTIGMTDLTLNASIALTPDPRTGPDAVVTAVVANTGPSARTVTLETEFPADPTRQIPINDLAAGAKTTRRFMIPGGAQRLAGKRVRVSLLAADDDQRLTRTLRIP